MSHFNRDPFPATPQIWSVPVPPAGLVQRLKSRLAVWRERVRMRQVLATIDARTLRELGISPEQAGFEASQPFWRRPSSLR
jgi:uncharacterized protein YjiS (DUF1127 family)